MPFGEFQEEYKEFLAWKKANKKQEVKQDYTGGSQRIDLTYKSSKTGETTVCVIFIDDDGMVEIRTTPSNEFTQLELNSVTKVCKWILLKEGFDVRG